MPLKIKKIGSDYCPVVVCDQCGRDIEDGELGVCLFAELDSGEYQDPRFLHKACQRPEDFDLLWVPLEKVPDYLRVNLGLNGKAVE